MYQISICRENLKESKLYYKYGTCSSVVKGHLKWHVILN